jgi:beta-glucosidase
MMATVISSTASAQTSYPFQDPDLPLETRVDDLLGRLTLEEKISLLHQYQPAIPRLDIPAFRTGTEALHGVAWLGEATVFPQAIGMASTWNPDLLTEIGGVVCQEARGFNSQDPAFNGLNLWAPVVDPLRDPRWGRNEEGYSEDPTLTGIMATAYTTGMTGGDPDQLCTAPTLKHYLGYNNEVSRDVTSSNLRPRLLMDYYEPPFRAPIEADSATGVMAAYNLVNGRPMTVAPELDDHIRSWTDREIMNVTDAFAPNNLPGSQAYYADLAEGNAATLLAGIDSFTSDSEDSAPTTEALTEALDRGLITEADIDEAVGHILSIRFRLGDFDPDGGPYGDITAEVIGAPEHQALARQAATEAMVLLRNEGGALPLDASETGSVAVVGPLADTLYSDWYSGTLPYQITPLDGITARLGDGATVATSEGVDRITLRSVDTGSYVTATGTTESDVVTVAGEDASAPEAQFDVFDWGDDVVSLRNAGTNTVVGYNWGPFITRDAQPNDWFVQQQFSLEEQADGIYVIRYSGYETRADWFGDNKYVTIADDGSLALEAPDAASAAHFELDVVRSGVDEAVAAVTDADAAVVVVGSMPFITSRETNDRESMDLAPSQAELVKAVVAANPNTILVLETSYPDTIGWENENVPAILWTSHAGQETGNAVADVLFGDANPAGRLTQTWYRSVDELGDLGDYDIINEDMTYLYYDGDPLYAFGYGLSYTTFEYSPLRIDNRQIGSDEEVEISVTVTNTGDRDGDEVVQLYTHQRRSRVEQPRQQLRAFERVTIPAGEQRDVTFTLTPSDLQTWDVVSGSYVVEASSFDLQVGSASNDIRANGRIWVDGEWIGPRDLSDGVRAIDFDDYSSSDTIALVDESKERGNAISGMADGGWISFAHACVEQPETVTLEASNATGEPAVVEVRLGQPDGTLVASFEVPDTGSVYDYQALEAQVDLGQDQQPKIDDVYLVLDPGVRVSTFSMS